MHESKPPPPPPSDAPGEPKRLRLTPSRNQKQRSKLRQGAEGGAPPAAAPAPPPTPAPPPPAPPAIAEPVIRKLRLKRSGQMREDLFRPDDAQPAKREDEY